MSLSKDESRAVGFVLLLLLLVGAGRMVLRAPTPVPDLPTVNLATLEKQSQAALEHARRAATPLRPKEKLNVNAVPSDELERLPGIGPTLARAIVGAREKDGPFATTADLAEVPGLSPARVEKLLPHISFGPSHGLPVRTHAVPTPAPTSDPASSSAASPTTRDRAAGRRPAAPRRVAGQGRGSVERASGEGVDAAPRPPRTLVNPNEASLAELQTIPGVGPVLAARIIAWREKSGPFHSPDDLLEVSGIGPAKLARIKPFVSIP